MIGKKNKTKTQFSTDLISSKSNNTIKQILSLVKELETEHNFNDILELIKTKKYEDELLNAPIGIFNQKELGMLESLVKYLKENKELKYIQIATLLNRDQRTIWNTYNKAKKKHKKKLTFSKDDIKVPVEIFQNRKLGPLEILSIYLKKQNLNFTQIAKLLSRDPRTIWAAHNKGVKKNE